MLLQLGDLGEVVDAGPLEQLRRSAVLGLGIRRRPLLLLVAMVALLLCAGLLRELPSRGRRRHAGGGARAAAARRSGPTPSRRGRWWRTSGPHLGICLVIRKSSLSAEISCP